VKDFRVVPVTRAEANAYVAHVHRHNGPLPSSRYQVGLIGGDGTVHGVAIAGLPKSRLAAKDRGLLEVSRVATDGSRNACSALYGACTRGARAFGFSRLVTFTLEREAGASLKASGWTVTGESDGGRWERDGRPCNDIHDLGPKLRWEIRLTDDIPELVWPYEAADEAPTLWAVS
jgi:hypothetical protein